MRHKPPVAAPSIEQENHRHSHPDRGFRKVNGIVRRLGACAAETSAADVQAPGPSRRNDDDEAGQHADQDDEAPAVKQPREDAERREDFQPGQGDRHGRRDRIVNQLIIADVFGEPDRVHDLFRAGINKEPGQVEPKAPQNNLLGEGAPARLRWPGEDDVHFRRQFDKVLWGGVWFRIRGHRCKQRRWPRSNGRCG